MKLKYFLLIIVFVSNVFSPLIRAETIADKTKQLTHLQKKIKQISQNINQLKTKKNTLQAELKSLEIKYGQTTVFLKKLAQQIKKQRIVIKKNRQVMDNTEQQIDEQKHHLAIQVKAAHAMGRNEKLKLILNQQDPVLSGRMMIYYHYLTQNRLQKIASINNNLQTLRVLETKGLKENALLEKKLQKRTVERSALLKTKTSRKMLLGKINHQFASKKQQLSQFKDSEKRLQSLILSLQQTVDDFPLEEGAVKAFALLKGQLPWPVKGQLIKKFGSKRSDAQWDGVLIKAKEGTEISAITRGRVVYADWLRGYGLLTIIEHGKGYMSLYAFNQSLYKTVGDWVEAGTIIATIGQSGGQVEAGLYFGIRKKGKPVNPIQWCKRIRHGKVG